MEQSDVGWKGIIVMDTRDGYASKYSLRMVRVLMQTMFLCW